MQTRSCWQLAEHAGDQSPHRMQRLLGEVVWDADAVRGDAGIRHAPRPATTDAAATLNIDQHLHNDPGLSY